MSERGGPKELNQDSTRRQNLSERRGKGFYSLARRGLSGWKEGKGYQA